MSDSTKSTSFAPTVRQFTSEELGPVHGVTCDADGNVWFAHDEGALLCLEPESGRIVKRLDNMQAMSGTAFDGTHLWQITTDAIVRIDPGSGEVVKTLPKPEGVHCSGMAFAAGCLWVGAYVERQLLKLDAETGEVLGTLDSDCFVTGIEWIQGELWHGAWTGDKSDEKRQTSLRRLDPNSGEVTRELRLEDDWTVSGTGVDRDGRLWCGGSYGGGLRAVRLS